MTKHKISPGQNSSKNHFFSVIFFLFLFLIPKESFCQDNFADLHQDNFNKSEKARQFFAFGGGYKSDYNSDEYEILSGYNYRSKKFIHELDFLHEVTNNSTVTKPKYKNKELYDFEASSRIRMGESSNYVNLYNRIRYDEFSVFYYNVASAAGIGKFFLNGNLESSINLGYNEVKNFDSGPVLIGVLNANIKITDNIRLSTRGLLERSELTYDEDIKNVLSFKLKENLFFELIHRYQKDRYVDSAKKLGSFRVNRVSRESYARFKYNF